MVDMDDDKIQMISRMLEIGGTMLAQHCDSCGAPMFRYKGDVFCPVCKEVDDPRTRLLQKASVEASPSIKAIGTHVREHIVPHNISHSAPAQEQTKETTPVPAGSKKTPVPLDGSSAGELEDLLMQKMVSLARSMQAETDVRKMADALDILERGISLIEKMKRTL
ncbi:MAG: hypothetical protein PWR29_1750 [Methanolobus sp.]|jgi:UPF0148 protein|nr:hypothetical protein [Methanolobus sp.]MDK2834491.1 hypothetical protein [Methanolobus sp.]MDK2912793.1 hypothetical protein [Methanolobus sp.]MDN5309150.1 hypothetical protein [Methanolobus sp.]